MILTLAALGAIDWLTTALILRRGGYERMAVAKWAMGKIGLHPFFAIKTAIMAGFGLIAPWWLSAPVAAWYVGIAVNNVLVLRRLPKSINHGRK